MYCSGCAEKCQFPCQKYIDYMAVISRCLTGDDPCRSCANKFQFDCPIHGDEKDNYEALKPWL
jgi:hypothetical protein